VYELNDQIVGAATLLPRFNEGVDIISWVYVHSKYRRKGIGTALIRHIEEVARRPNLRKLLLTTLEKA